MIRRKPRLRRLALITILAGALVGTACGGDDDDGGANGGEDSGALQTVTITAGAPEGVVLYAFSVADELGFFAEEGIELDFQFAGDDVNQIALLQNGNTDIATPGAEELLIGINEGEELVNVFDPFDAVLEGIVVLDDSPIQSVTDLEGATVGLAEDAYSTLFDTILELEGMSVEGNNVETVNVGTVGPTVARALENGDIDAYVAGIPDYASLTAAGFAIRNITPEALVAAPPITFVTTPENLEKFGEDIITGVLRAYAKGAYVGQAKFDIAAAIMKQRVPEDFTDEGAGEALMGEFTKLYPDEDYGQIDQSVWQEAVNQFLDGALPEGVTLDDFLDDSYIAGANDWDKADVDAAAEAWLADNPQG